MDKQITQNMKVSDNTLKTLQNNEVLVDIYTDHFNESFFGFILNYNNDFLLLEHYNEDGLYNGIIVFRREDITRIRWDNNEINSVLSLIKRVENFEIFSRIKIDSLKNVLKSINEVYFHLSLRIQNINTDWSIIGQLEEMDSETIIIKEFGTMSTLDRAYLMFSTNEITRIDADGIYENNIIRLHNKNN
jgi:hypothetical protein